MEIQIDPAHAACFTGHRKINASLLASLQAQMTSLVQAFIQTGVDIFLVGGARGFDTLAADVILHLQASYPQTRLILVLPFENPYEKEGDWTPEEIQAFHRIQAQASQVILLHQHYRRGCYYERNRYLVDHASFCFCLCCQTRKTGGTAYTTQYAKSCGRSVYNFAKKIKKETGEM